MNSYVIFYRDSEEYIHSRTYEADNMIDAIKMFEDDLEDDDVRITMIRLDDESEDISDIREAEHDRMLEQQELEDFEQADEYFGYASDVFGVEF